LIDGSVIAVASEDDALLGFLSSVVGVTWSAAAGGRMGVGNDLRYHTTTCFDPLPFPDLRNGCGSHLGVTCTAKFGETGSPESDDTTPIDRIRHVAEQLENHRKRQQLAHADLTLTGMYNALEKLRSGEPLTAKERVIHGQGLVSVLRQIHDELDAAVLEAYGWSDLLPLLRVAHGNDAPADGQTRDEAKRAFEEAVLERLVALNAERAAEEARGLVRWLRPEFQNPDAARAPEQGALVADEDDSEPEAAAPAAAATGKPRPWPKDPVEQVRAVADLIAASPVPLSLDEIGDRFSARGPWKRRLPGLLDMLVALGRAQEQVDGRYAAA
jgi:hypothetical protein